MTYAIPSTQELQSLDPKDYKNRVIVSGTRYWTDKKMFHDTLIEYLTRFDSPILFISGANSTGADRLIIDWCKKFKYPCLEVPADWDTQGKGAGYSRNSDMAELATHLLCFWDMISSGTKHMREVAIAKDIKVTTVAIPKTN